MKTTRKIIMSIAIFTVGAFLGLKVNELNGYSTSVITPSITTIAIVFAMRFVWGKQNPKKVKQ